MGDILLQASGISKHFGGVKALDKVDLQIRKGEIHCLSGENGSGKSTLIKILSGFYKPDEGTICFDGETYTFTVESYLCDNTTDVYKTVQSLQVGDTVDMEGFLYWYEGVNPHITSVTVK